MKKYIHGQRPNTACDFIDVLKSEHGVSAAVGYPRRNDGTLIAIVRGRVDVSTLPEEFRGFRIEYQREKVAPSIPAEERRA